MTRKQEVQSRACWRAHADRWETEGKPPFSHHDDKKKNRHTKLMEAPRQQRWRQTDGSSRFHRELQNIFKNKLRNPFITTETDPTVKLWNPVQRREEEEGEEEGLPGWVSSPQGLEGGVGSGWRKRGGEGWMRELGEAVCAPTPQPTVTSRGGRGGGGARREEEMWKEWKIRRSSALSQS